MRVYATVQGFECRGDYRPGVRSFSYYDPDEPPFVEDVEIHDGGEWICVDDAGEDAPSEDAVVEALIDAGRQEA